MKKTMIILYLVALCSTINSQTINNVSIDSIRVKSKYIEIRMEREFMSTNLSYEIYCSQKYDKSARYRELVNVFKIMNDKGNEVAFSDRPDLLNFFYDHGYKVIEMQILQEAVAFYYLLERIDQ